MSGAPSAPGKCDNVRLASLLEETRQAHQKLNDAWNGLAQGMNSADDYNNAIMLVEILQCKINRT